MITIRKAEAIDLEDLFAMDSRTRLIENAVQRGECLVARFGENLAGFLVFDRTFFGHSFISLVEVRGEYRRMGIGSALMRQVERVAPPGKLFTSTNESNTAMRNLCEKLEYIKSGYIENLDEDDPEVIYFKRLGG